MPAHVRPFAVLITLSLTLAMSFAYVSMPAQAATPPLTVDLGTSASYSVLAGSEITNTLTTDLQGDLGVSPGTAITGFPPGVTQGMTNIGVTTPANQAQSDARSAYTDAKTRVFTETLLVSDIANTEFKSGVFKAADALAVSADGVVTLDGEHDNNSVFIFQVGSALNIGARTKIELINGAQACHVFWQVGSAATIGAASTFNGTILADAAITVGATTTVDGRALAGSAITLADNTFVSGKCDTKQAGDGDSDGDSDGAADGGGTGDGASDGAADGGGTGDGASDGAADGGGTGDGFDDGSDGQALPETGAGSRDAPLLALGLLLTMGGAVLVFESRRRPGLRRRL